MKNKKIFIFILVDIVIFSILLLFLFSNLSILLLSIFLTQIFLILIYKIPFNQISSILTNLSESLKKFFLSENVILIGFLIGLLVLSLYLYQPLNLIFLTVSIVFLVIIFIEFINTIIAESISKSLSSNNIADDNSRPNATEKGFTRVSKLMIEYIKYFNNSLIIAAGFIIGFLTSSYTYSIYHILNFCSLAISILFGFLYINVIGGAVIREITGEPYFNITQKHLSVAINLLKIQLYSFIISITFLFFIILGV